jgi:hypothetical protein
VTLWTQRLNVRWRRTITFFERQYEILRELEANDLLWQFRTEPERISVRVGDAYHRLSFGVGHVEGALLAPDGDLSRIQNAMRIVLEAIEPDRLVRPELSAQWLMPLESDYDEARKAGIAALVGEVAASVTDWAFVFDGQLESPELTYHLEAGIVQSSEIPSRLSRVAGSFTPDPEAPPTLWATHELPDVAFFCDSDFTVADRLEASPDALFSLWEGTRNAAEGVVSGVMERLGIRDDNE